MRGNDLERIQYGTYLVISLSFCKCYISESHQQWMDGFLQISPSASNQSILITFCFVRRYSPTSRVARCWRSFGPLCPANNFSKRSIMTFALLSTRRSPPGTASLQFNNLSHQFKPLSVVFAIRQGPQTWRSVIFSSGTHVRTYKMWSFTALLPH